jgi:osmotically-inducible protein OsmY
MNTYKLTALALLAACAPALMASSDTDKKIEEAATSSYNYKTVLQGKVDVSSDNGNVTLTGKVPNKDQKELAEDTVANLPGVLTVTNQIEVVPIAPVHSDAWIAFEINGLLAVKPHVSATSTTVNVANGEVTLTGTADSQAQKDLTEVYVREVEGVKSVDNNITVADNPPKESLGEDMDDASITGQIKLALLDHKSTSAVGTKVTTDKGMVTITGAADSETEKALVTQLAEQVRGVKSVDNQMNVKGS